MKIDLDECEDYVAPIDRDIFIRNFIPTITIDTKEHLGEWWIYDKTHDEEGYYIPEDDRFYWQGISRPGDLVHLVYELEPTQRIYQLERETRVSDL